MVRVEVYTASVYFGSAVSLPVLLCVTADSPNLSMVPGGVSAPPAAAGAADVAAPAGALVAGVALLSGVAPALGAALEVPPASEPACLGVRQPSGAN